MNELATLHQFGATIRAQLGLTAFPLAVKFLSDEAEIPTEAFRPAHDRSQHFSQCQAFKISRSEGMTVAMTKSDLWCWAPLVGFGFASFDAAMDVPEAAGAASSPRLPEGQYKAVVSAPLSEASFVPDLVLVYANPAQLRIMLAALKAVDGTVVETTIDPGSSCLYSTVPTMLTGKIRVTLPDPGETKRALTSHDQVILTLPLDKVETLVEGLTRTKAQPLAEVDESAQVESDYPVPDFYKRLWKAWGLEDPGN
jgi:uncharacterized protein (DUF169 family)